MENTEKIYTKEQMLKVLIDWDQSLTPENYPDSNSLSSIDFSDAALCEAQELGLEKEFIEAQNAKGFSYPEAQKDQEETDTIL